MSKEFSYPEFENGVKILSRAGDAANDMMMNITVYLMKAGQTLTLPRASAKDAEGKAIEVYTMVVYPDGRIEKTNGSVVLQSVGVYKIRYVCVDRDYNVTAREYLTEVR